MQRSAMSACAQRAQRAAQPARRTCVVYSSADRKVLKIGTRGSPLALAQAYMTRDLLKVCAIG